MLFRSPRQRATALLLAGSALCSGFAQANAPAKPAKPAAPALAVVNFVDVDIDAVARAISAILGRPILLDPRVRGKITLYSQDGLTPTQTYDYFTSTLRGLGYAVIDKGGLLKIVPETDAKQQAGPVLLASPTQAREQIVTRLFPLTHENANNLVPVLRPLISPNNTINVNAGTNTLVITDYADNQERLAAIIASLDTPSATDIEVIPLQKALASDVATVAQKLLEAAPQQGGTSGGTGGGAGGGAAAQAGANTGNSSGLMIVADTRNNSLLVRAPNQARLATIRALVARLDQAGSSGAGGSGIHVIYLKNAEATRLATVLRAAFSALDQHAAGSSSGSGGEASPRAGSSSGGGMATSLTGASSGSSSGSSSSQSAQSTNPVSAAAQPSTGGFIQADPASNSLIITAPEPRFRELREVVELLDSSRAQVYVESLIVEVDASKSLDLGVQWSTILSYSSSSTLSLSTIISALETMSGTNILSTANLLTLDNEEAKIVVGQNVPFVTGSYTSTSSTSPFQTIERKDVGITLRIRPQIGPNGNVRMSIYQESSSVSSTTAAGTSNAGPTTNKRAIESTVTVKDGRFIVLGGLIEDSATDEANDLHGLAKLPLIGGLFRSTSTTRKKTNLLVFLRPVVMPDDDAAQQLTLDRYAYIRAQQGNLPKDVRTILERASPPALSPLMQQIQQLQQQAAPPMQQGQP